MLSYKRTISADKSKMSEGEGEKEKTCKHNIVCQVRIDLYFHDYKRAIKIDENGHSDGNIDYEIKRQKAIEHELGCEFIRIDPNKENFNIFEAINEYLDTSNSCLKLNSQLKKFLIGKIS